MPLFSFLSSKLPCRGCLVTQEPNQTVIPDFPQTPKGQWDTFKHQTAFTSDKHWKAPQSVSFPRANLWETLPWDSLSILNLPWYISTNGLYFLISTVTNPGKKKKTKGLGESHACATLTEPIRLYLAKGEVQILCSGLELDLKKKKIIKLRQLSHPYYSANLRTKRKFVTWIDHYLLPH